MKNKDLIAPKLENIVYNFEQRSEDWHKVKELKISTSGCDKIMKLRGLGVGGKTYCMQIVKSSLLKNREETYKSQAMQQGIDREPLAAEVYEQEMLVETQEVGFIVYNQEWLETRELNGFLGISPDRLVGEDGGLEIKCPEPDQHTANLAEEVCHDKYYDQIQMCLFVTGRLWWDLISYNPDFKEGFQFKITRNYPDKNWQHRFIQRAKECKKIVEEILEKINR